MQPLCAGAYLALPRPFRHRIHFSPLTPSSSLYNFPRIFCNFNSGRRRKPQGGKQKVGGDRFRAKEKDNVWSIDNELASSEERSTAQRRRIFPRIFCNSNSDRRRKRQGGKQKVGGDRFRAKEKDNVWSIDNELSSSEERNTARRRRRVKGAGRRGCNSAVLVSAAMLIEIETVLQTQEPVIKPAWDTFSSSVTGIWKGIGAVFSPFTAEMEPVEVGNQNENLYDCYTLSRIEKVPFESPCCQIRRKTNWVTLNPLGETRKHARGGYRDNDRDDGSSVPGKKSSDVIDMNLSYPSYGSFDFGSSEVLEEDSMSMEPGLVFFEDGSYSRGPVNIPVGEFHESKYFLNPTFKFEQCLVKGCHKRLRIVHTIEFNEGGSNIQITRVAVYEEQWVSPVNLYDENDVPSDMKPFSQRRRTQPSELTGSWKVFEVSATPIFSEETEPEEGGLYVYLCTEALKKRSPPESSAGFGEEEILDMQDATVLWLPGGVTGYVDVRNDSVLCIGVGWYSEEGVNLVMERDYGMDGRLKEVRMKSEVKRRCGDSPSP